MEKSVSYERFKSDITAYLKENKGVELIDATKKQLYCGISYVVNKYLLEKYNSFSDKSRKGNNKRICYLSMEFLPGRNLRNNLFNLGLLDECNELILECSYEPDQIFSIERDPALGNGGLGRLASAYMDALATCDYKGEGYSILYDYGLFMQCIKDGRQYELPDLWIDSSYAFLNRDNERTISVKVGGEILCEGGEDTYCDYSEIIAVGYDMYISGYDSLGVSKMRLWKACANHKFDMSLLTDGKFDELVSKRGEAELVSMFLYPPDNTRQGKKLRLLQQYFFVSSTVQYVISDHFKKFRTVDNIPDLIAFHINDTHPSLCIPELIRVLVEDYSTDFEKAFEITRSCVTYTNHTVMPEALECWDEDIVNELIPRVYRVLQELNRRQMTEVYKLSSSQWDCIGNTSILSNGSVKMANLCVFASKAVNGVSELHSKILERDLFSDFYSASPAKFTNVTNGITYRRWLCQANPELCKVIESVIGKAYRAGPHELLSLKDHTSDKRLLDDIKRARYKNKVKLSELSKRLCGFSLDPDSMYDVQIKRLHEYKRQLLNVLKIISYYLEIKNNKNAEIYPKTFIFAAKAAPTYHHAKRIIKLINSLASLINADCSVNDKLKVVFLPDYNVTLAESIIPAADVSEQISLAGKEASGTGNMKLMLNGALTIGTYDGANVEISRLVGEDNIYIFG
ncbi:MAG: glycogen/starch/alpha-glucan family phosphorylase, partial [Clostridia bacterium]|nr:glycogen/starch/alpha-glucan family phosphorylase [Clostridia bacterium]